MLHRHLTVVPVPPSFRDPTDPVPGRTRHVGPAGWTVERRPEPLVAVLREPAYRVTAEAVRSEVAALPGPERAAEELERLARPGGGGWR